jgi:alpha-D-ribose 1-methylphosphonate 5-triphosphate synthase subunit PhnG
LDRLPLQIMETVIAARTVIVQLHDRASASRNTFDLGDLSVIQTTVRKIEELLEFAAEHDDILRRQLERTNARLALPLP